MNVIYGERKLDRDLIGQRKQREISSVLWYPFVPALGKQVDYLFTES
jgi:hypothetical protein